MYISVAQKLPEIWPETWMYQFCDFCIFCVLVKKIRQFLQNPVFAKIYFLTFLAISPAIFELQRCTIPHFNPLNNSFWPYGEPFCCRANSFWVIRPNVSTIFFRTHFIYLVICKGKYNFGMKFLNFFGYQYWVHLRPCNSVNSYPCKFLLWLSSGNFKKDKKKHYKTSKMYVPGKQEHSSFFII